MTFNESQTATILETGNELVLAGPGAGKTSTLVGRIVHLIHLGHHPSKMLVVTFTNESAAELRKRVDAAVNLGASGPRVPELGYIGTLHGFLLRLITEHHAVLGLPERLSVIDDETQVGMLETVAAEMGVKGYNAKKESATVGWPEDKSTMSKAECVAREYRLRCRSSGLLDFDAILHHGLEAVLLACRDGSDKWPWECLFVDEAQDASQQDWDIYMAMKCDQKFIVGDFDQRIFSFRGGCDAFEIACKELAK